MKLLIDADLVAYRCAASAENADKETACNYADNLIDQFLVECGADNYQCYLTGSTNFRYQVFPEYKAHRAKQEKPRFLQDVRAHLIEVHKAIVSEGCEADDLMGIEQTRLRRIAGLI